MHARSYLFFFLLGLHSTGPYVIMLFRMIKSDFTRWLAIFLVFLIGFAQALASQH